MYYTYTLLSKKDYKFYTGYTVNLKTRLEQHQRGKVKSTAGRLPLVLVYYEACLNEKDAIQREKYLKTGFGRRFLKNRLENFFCSGSRWQAGKNRQKLQLTIDEKKKRIIIEDWKR